MKECVQRRRKFRDVANTEVLDRLESFNENEWASSEIKWHKTCYSTFSSEQHIRRLQKKQMNQMYQIRKQMNPHLDQGNGH